MELDKMTWPVRKLLARHGSLMFSLIHPLVLSCFFYKYTFSKYQYINKESPKLAHVKQPDISTARSYSPRHTGQYYWRLCSYLDDLRA
jgi:hypothetical protein